MAKKFGKLLLFGTAVCAISAGVYYYLQKKENEDWDDDDFDDFDDEDEVEDMELDLEERSYVSLTPITKPAEDKTTPTEEQPTEEDAEDTTVEPLQSDTEIKETEDFFDEDDEE